MTIALTITLAAVVTFYGVRLVWQYHRTVAHEHAVQRRLSALQHERQCPMCGLPVPPLHELDFGDRIELDELR